MWRTTRRLLLVLAVALALAFVTVGATTRPDLERARDDAVERWRPLRGPLDGRYSALADLNASVQGAGGHEREVSAEIDVALAAWRASAGAPVAAQVEAANELEGLARRLTTTIAASERLTADPAVAEAFEELGGHPIPESARAFNGAADDYHEARDGFLREPVAGLLGHDALPRLDIGSADDR